MKYLLFIVILVLAMITAGCISGSKNATTTKAESNNISDDEYAVYSSFITQEFINKSKIILLRQTIGRNTNSNFKQFSSQYISDKKSQILRNDTYEDFIVRNRVKGTFTGSKLPAKVQLIDVEEVNQIFESLGNQTQGWENLSSRFPDVEGISSVSRVGFSHDNSQAALYAISMNKGSIWQSGDFFVFSKKNGIWTLSETIKIWSEEEEAKAATLAREKEAREKAECIASGGGWEHVIVSIFEYNTCIYSTHDGGKSCSDSSECEGDCIIMDGDCDYGSSQSLKNVTGNCTHSKPYLSTFTCFVENGTIHEQIV